MSIIKGAVVDGQVARVISGRGFCFMDVEGQEDQVFCHTSGFTSREEFNSLSEGDLVSMELEDTDKGVQGKNITIKR